MGDGFEDIVNALSPKLRAIAHRMNGHFTYFSDEDLYQEAVINLWGLFYNGDLNEKTNSYILQSCYFHLKNYLRVNLDKAKLVSINEPIDTGGYAIEDTLTHQEADRLKAADMMLEIGKALNDKLSERERHVLKLLLDGVTLREIGLKLGVSHVMAVKIKTQILIKCRKVVSE